MPTRGEERREEGERLSPLFLLSLSVVVAEAMEDAEAEAGGGGGRTRRTRRARRHYAPAAVVAAAKKHIPAGLAKIEPFCGEQFHFTLSLSNGQVQFVKDCVAGKAISSPRLQKGTLTTTTEESAYLNTMAFQYCRGRSQGNSRLRLRGGNRHPQT